MTTKPSPAGWPRISASLFYDDAATAIDWLCRAFGFEVRLKVDGEKGDIIHSELTLGEGVIMVATSDRRPGHRSPKALGGTTQALFAYVDDADAHCARARSAGAKIQMEPATVDYGEGYWSDRGYQCEDPEGHSWYFAHRVRS